MISSLPGLIIENVACLGKPCRTIVGDDVTGLSQSFTMVTNININKMDYRCRTSTRRRVLSNLKELISSRISMKSFHKKQKSLKLGQDNRTENIYVTLLPKKFQEPPRLVNRSISTRFKIDISQCPSCYFGDPVLTCTCSFRNSAPDFKLYEDDEMFRNNFQNCH